MIYDPGGKTKPDEVPRSQVVHVPAYVIKDSTRWMGSLFAARSNFAKMQAHFGANLEVSIDLCTDTCARTTGILKESFVQKLPWHLRKLSRPGSEESQAVILQAFDGEMEAVPDRHIKYPTKIGSRVKMVPFLVCKRAAHDALIGTGGIDFMQLVINVPNSKFLLKGSEGTVPLAVEEAEFVLSKQRCDAATAKLVEDVAIPAYSERMAVAGVGGSSNISWTARVEGNETLHAQTGSTTAHGVAEIKKGHTRLVLANFTERSVLLPKKTNVATLEPMSKVRINAVRARKSYSEDGGGRRDPGHGKNVLKDLSAKDLELAVAGKTAVVKLFDKHLMNFHSACYPVGRTSTTPAKNHRILNLLGEWRLTNSMLCGRRSRSSSERELFANPAALGLLKLC